MEVEIFGPVLSVVRVKTYEEFDLKSIDGLQIKKSFGGDINWEINQNDPVVEITTSTPTVSEKIHESPVEKRIRHVIQN